MCVSRPAFAWDPVVVKDVNAVWNPALVRDVTNITSDAFWGPRLTTVRDTSVPYGWEGSWGGVMEAMAATLPNHPTVSYAINYFDEGNFGKNLEGAGYILAQWPTLADTAAQYSTSSKPLITYSSMAARAADAAAKYRAGQLSYAARKPAHAGYCKFMVMNRDPNIVVPSGESTASLSPWTNMWGQHDGYSEGHMIEGAVAHYMATQDTSWLTVAQAAGEEAYNWFIVQGNPGFCGHAQMEPALHELYRVTGNTHFRDVGDYFVRIRGHNANGSTTWDPAHPNIVGGDGTGAWKGYFQDDLPIEQQTAINGHAVRAVYYWAGAADSVLTGQTQWYNPMLRVWKDDSKRKVYVTGGVGSVTNIPSINLTEAFSPNDYDLNNENSAGCYCESCAACGQNLLAWRMARLKGDADSVDEMERTLYNAVAHGLSADGIHMYYPNPLTDQNNPHYLNWVCCPPNLYRTIAGIGRFIYGWKANDIWVNLFVTSNCTFALTNGNVPVAMTTNSYPWDGRVTITVTPATPTNFTMHIRMPGWCRNALLRVNGKVITKPTITNRYIVINRTWSSGDQVVFNMAMTPMRVEAHPSVVADVGRVCIQRGPIIFGIEGVDNGGGSLADPVISATPNLQASYNASLLGGVEVITANKQGGGTLTFVPWHMMAQRSNSWQRVWVQQESKSVRSAGWDNQLYREYTP